MNKQNEVGVNENASKQSILKSIFHGDTYVLNNIKKTLLLDNLPKLMSIFGLSGFCFSVGYLLLCSFCCPERWVVALFQIILFGSIYYYGMKKSTSKF